MIEPPKIKIAIVDDHLILRQGLITLLAKEESFDIVGDYNNGLEFIESLETNCPDLILLDIDMPLMNGVETIQHLKKIKPQVQVIMLSLHFSNLYIQQFFEMGARGFLSKGTDIKVLIEAIKEVHQGDYFFSDNVSRYSINELVSKHKITPKVQTQLLSDIEIQILRLLCLEKSSKDIADELNLSTRTIEHHRERLLDKTKTKNVIGLIIYAFYNHILNIRDFPKSGINT